MESPNLSTKSSADSLWSGESSFSTPENSLPPVLVGPMAWSGSGWNQLESTYNLSAIEIDEIRASVMRFKLLDLPRSAIDKSTFPLSFEFAAKLAALSVEVHKGSGITIVRGLNSAKLNDEQAVIAFAGICSHIAPQRATDSYANQTLSHIRDASRDSVPVWAEGIGLAGSKVPVGMDFHSDRFSGDLLALYVRDDGGAASGGEQFVVSFWRIYNELLMKDPAVLEALARPTWPFELKKQNQDPYLELSPVLFFSGEKPMLQLAKAPLLGTPLIQRDPSMPALSDPQIHALQVVDELAKKFCVQLSRQEGDIQIINNLSIMHARSAYGSKNRPSTRHLLRMFLRDPSLEWEKDKMFRNKFNDPFTAGRQQNLPVIDLDPWRKISGRDSHG